MVTIKDVAKRAGVSVATVSRVLNKKGPLSDEAIARVTEAVEELNYYPNLLARSLAGGRNNTLGVILPSFDMSVASKLARELELCAKENKYSVIFSVAPSETKERLAAVEYLRNFQVKGVIFCGSMWGDHHLQNQFRQMKNLPLLGVIDQAHGIPCIVSDDGMGGTLAARHLVSKGCRNLVHISSNLRIYKHADERSYSFIEECERNAVSYKKYENHTYMPEEEEVNVLMEQILRECPQVDGMFLKNDILAARCIRYLQSRGIKVPEDIRVIGYDDMYFSSLLTPQLTTVRHDYRRIAETAIRNIMDQIEGKKVPDLTTIPVELIERETA